MMITIFAQTDKIMLKFMVNNEAVGYHAATVMDIRRDVFIFGIIIGL